MTDPGIYKEPVQQMQADIRLEVLLAEMLADDAALDDIVVMSNSLFKRNFHRDCSGICCMQRSWTLPNCIASTSARMC